MKIEHIAMWTSDLERSKLFYEKYFGATSNQKYHNPKKQFSSYFLTFDSGARLELMQAPYIPLNKNTIQSQNIGLIHFAIEIGTREEVDKLTERIRSEGYIVFGEPRETGDGYYESIVLDPDKNLIELVASE